MYFPVQYSCEWLISFSSNIQIDCDRKRRSVCDTILHFFTFTHGTGPASFGIYDATLGCAFLSFYHPPCCRNWVMRSRPPTYGQGYQRVLFVKGHRTAVSAYAQWIGDRS